MKCKPLFSLGLLALSLCIFGCSSDSGSSDPIVVPDDSDEESDVDSLLLYELKFNHKLLSVFYINAQSELDTNAMVYYGQSSGMDTTKGICTAEFADVCGMYNSLSDHFTRYYDPAVAPYVWNSFAESAEEIGMGAQVKKIGDSLVVTEVYASSPGKKAGMQEGDLIVEVDGSIPKTEEAFKKLTTGKVGEKIEIIVSRNGKEDSLTVQLETYKVPTVHLTKESGIPVITISEFSEITASDKGTYGEFLSIVKKVKEDSTVKSIVIDLRDNHGGSEAQCLNIASEFLHQGDTLVQEISTSPDSIVEADSITKDEKVKWIQKLDTTVYNALSEGSVSNYYFVFLANETSASCTELMLSAITTNQKFPVVGKTTYGKGIGQTIKQTLASGLTFITALRVIDKQGNSYHKYGIAPDFDIDDADEQLQKAIELAKDATEKRTAGYGEKPTGHFKKVRATNDLESLRHEVGLYRLEPLQK